MSANPPNAITVSKVSNVGGKTPSSSNQASPAQTQVGFTAITLDGHGQRRSGGSGSFGAGATSRTAASPRNIQTSRKQNKTSKRLNGFVDEDVLADAANMRTTSRKGQTNITHLMNYSVSSSHQFTHRHLQRDHRHGRRTPTWGPGSGYHAVDKARYIHANYRFIVNPRANCQVQCFDADVHLDWDNVLQILASSQSQEASCPICLGTPVAPRMAKCGHIFCLPCLIRYMHSEDTNTTLPERKSRSKKCPICHDHVWLFETRPVRFYMGQEGEPPREGSDLVLRLMMRSPESTFALPKDGADALPKDDEVPWYFAAEVLDYARMMKGTEEYMCQQHDNEIAALELQEKEDEVMFGEDNVEWMRKAIRAIKEAKEKLKGIGGPSADPPKRVAPKITKPVIELRTPDDAPDMYHIQHAATSGQSPATISRQSTSALVPQGGDSSTIGISSTDPNILRGTLSHTQSSHHQGYGSYAPLEYYFYQALLHYYLSPLDIRILREAFGNFHSFPSTILPRVERVSTGHVVDDELRRRTKYLAHLPYGCEVNFLECDWTDTVSAEVLEKFKPEIERRRKRNEEKEAREEKARAHAEKEEEKRYSYLRRKRPETAVETERPFAPDDFQPLIAAEVADDAEAAGVDSVSGSPPWPRRSGSGFASLASMSTSPSASRTVWGTPVLFPPSPSQLPVAGEHELRDDGWLQGWERDLLQEEDDLVAQAEAMSLGAGESSKTGAAGGGGKKKKKKITLMSTNVRRGA